MGGTPQGPRDALAEAARALAKAVEGFGTVVAGFSQGQKGAADATTKMGLDLGRVISESQRETSKLLSNLAGSLAGPVQITARDALSNDIFVPFEDNATITGTTGLTVWTPQTGRRFVLRGGYVAAVVDTILATGGTGGTLYLDDSGTSKVVCPLGGFGATSAVGTVINAGQLPIDLRDGVAGSVVGATVRIKTSVTIGSGVLAVAGILWGTERPS